MGLSSPGIAKHTGSRVSAGQSGRPASSNPRGLKSPHKRTSRHPPPSTIDLTTSRQDGQVFVDLTRDHDVPVQQDPVLVSHAGSGIVCTYNSIGSLPVNMVSLLHIWLLLQCSLQPLFADHCLWSAHPVTM